MITAVPPTYMATSSWLLHPVTWNSGTEIRVRRPSGVTESAAAAGLGVGEEVLVPGHGALGEAGGAAGVEDRGRVGRGLVVDDERATITLRELQVADLVAEGLSNPAIAAALCVSRRTVAAHVTHILTKLDLANRVQLAVWAATRQRSTP